MGLTAQEALDLAGKNRSKAILAGLDLSYLKTMKIHDQGGQQIEEKKAMGSLALPLTEKQAGSR
jgi:hypothetical protein